MKTLYPIQNIFKGKKGFNKVTKTNIILNNSTTLRIEKRFMRKATEEALKKVSFSNPAENIINKNYANKFRAFKHIDPKNLPPGQQMPDFPFKHVNYHPTGSSTSASAFTSALKAPDNTPNAFLANQNFSGKNKLQCVGNTGTLPVDPSRVTFLPGLQTYLDFHEKKLSAIDEKHRKENAAVMVKIQEEAKLKEAKLKENNNDNLNETNN